MSYLLCCNKNIHSNVAGRSLVKLKVVLCVVV